MCGSLVQLKTKVFIIYPYAMQSNTETAKEIFQRTKSLHMFDIFGISEFNFSFSTAVASWYLEMCETVYWLDIDTNDLFDDKDKKHIQKSPYTSVLLKRSHKAYSSVTLTLMYWTCVFWFLHICVFLLKVTNYSHISVFEELQPVHAGWTSTVCPQGVIIFI